MFTLLLIAAIAATGPPVDVETLGSEAVSGRLVRLNSDGVAVETADGPVSVGIDRMVAISPVNTKIAPPSASAVWVELVDGSLLLGRGYSTSGPTARLVTVDRKTLEFPVRDVGSVRFQPQTDSIAKEWSRIVEAAPDGDLLVVRKGQLIDFHEGLLRDVTDTLVQFESDGDVLPVKRPKVYGLRYHRSAARELPQPVCRLTDTFGSVWPVVSISLEDGVLKWTTPLGLEASVPLEMVVRIDYSRGKVVYLSEMEPEAVDWTPYFGPADNVQSLAKFLWPREDRSLDSGPLQLDGRPYERGLAIHSRTRLTYRLRGDFRRFKATAGIDDSVRPAGHVRLVIHGDGRVLFEADVAGTDAPKLLDLDVSGVRRLMILVDFGENLDTADHLDLCEARVVK
jgi:NPCBM/NEW2 domain-containing protein